MDMYVYTQEKIVPSYCRVFLKTLSGYGATFGLSGDALGAQQGVELNLHMRWEMTNHKEIVQDREMKVGGAGMKLTIEQGVVEGIVTLEKVSSHKSSLFFRFTR